MLRDSWGSDMDYDTAMGNPPDLVDYCPETGLRRDGCYHCHEHEIADASELEPIQAEDAMRVALRHMLDRINTGGRR